MKIFRIAVMAMFLVGCDSPGEGNVPPETAQAQVDAAAGLVEAVDELLTNTLCRCYGASMGYQSRTECVSGQGSWDGLTDCVRQVAERQAADYMGLAVCLEGVFLELNACVETCPSGSRAADACNDPANDGLNNCWARYPSMVAALNACPHLEFR